MKISSKARHAIESMLQLAMQVDNKPLTLADLTGQQGISSSYLEQLFANLRIAGFVEGVRGPGGGYRLAFDAKDISIGQVIVAVHPTHTKRPPSSGYVISIYNDMWWDLSESIHDFLLDISLADLMEREDVDTYMHQQRLFKGKEFNTDEIYEIKKQA